MVKCLNTGINPKEIIKCRKSFKQKIYIFKDFIYLFMRDTEKEAETQAEEEAGSSQGA